MKLLRVFILDVDGVLTTGQFFYTTEGKVMKVFGPDDHDALSLLKPYLEVRFVTGDRKGFDISRRRVADDMDFAIDLVSTINRVEWIRQRYCLEEVAYMGDGILDHYVFKEVGYSIAPANSLDLTKRYANYVTSRNGGDRAVAEACLHILDRFFEPYAPARLPADQVRLTGEWAV